MSWTQDNAPDHEGYAAYLVPDGRTTSAGTGLGVLLDRPDADVRAAAAHAAGRAPAQDELYELVAWADILGWQTECSCGWRGQTWTRTSTIPGQYGGKEPADAYLPGGSSVEDQAISDWNTHLQPVALVADIEAAAAAVRAAAAEVARATQRLDTAVAAGRAASPAITWDTIGRAVRITRQSAQERWGRRTATTTRESTA